MIIILKTAVPLQNLDYSTTFFQKEKLEKTSVTQLVSYLSKMPFWMSFILHGRNKQTNE